MLGVFQPPNTIRTLTKEKCRPTCKKSKLNISILDLEEENQSRRVRIQVGTIRVLEAMSTI